jgi:hypothetical protein
MPGEISKAALDRGARSRGDHFGARFLRVGRGREQRPENRGGIQGSAQGGDTAEGGATSQTRHDGILSPNGKLLHCPAELHAAPR